MSTKSFQHACGAELSEVCGHLAQVTARGHWCDKHTDCAWHALAKVAVEQIDIGNCHVPGVAHTQAERCVLTGTVHVRRGAAEHPHTRRGVDGGGGSSKQRSGHMSTQDTAIRPDDFPTSLRRGWHDAQCLGADVEFCRSRGPVLGDGVILGGEATDARTHHVRRSHASSGDHCTS